MTKTMAIRVPWSPDSWGVALNRVIERACAAQQPVLRAFADWLMEERGIGPQTIRQRVDSIAAFLTTATAGDALPCQQALASLTADGIEEFFVQYSKVHGMRTRHCLLTAMRSFLRFAALRGWVGRELAAAVPSLLGWQLSGLPRGLRDEELTKLLSSTWASGECPRRNRAILELLATYGVRREQVSALRLRDVHWTERTIDFAAHKGGKAVQHVLSATVAQSLATYLREERPSSDLASTPMPASGRLPLQLDGAGGKRDGLQPLRQQERSAFPSADLRAPRGDGDRDALPQQGNALCRSRHGVQPRRRERTIEHPRHRPALIALASSDE
jgi:site-specific recombinase XerD